MSTSKQEQALHNACSATQEAIRDAMPRCETTAAERSELEAQVQLLERIKSAMGRGYRWGAGALGRLYHRIRHLAATIWSWVKRAVRAVVAAVASVLNWLLNAARELVDCVFDIGDRALRVLFPSDEDIAEADLREINAAAVAAIRAAS